MTMGWTNSVSKMNSHKQQKLKDTTFYFLFEMKNCKKKGKKKGSVYKCPV